MVKTIFNLLIRYQIRKILFSLVEDKIHIFVRPSPVIINLCTGIYVSNKYWSFIFQ